MRIFPAVSAALLLWLVGGQRMASAQNILDWCDEAQVVCVATAGGSVPSQIVYNGTEPVLPIDTRFTLMRPLKGAPGATFAVTSYDYDWNEPHLPGEAPHRSQAPFRRGTTYLLFLTRKLSFGVDRPGLPLRLISGYTLSRYPSPSFLTLGTKLPPPRPADSSLRAILRLLLASLANPSPPIQAEAVSALGSYGPFLWNYAAYPDLAGSPEGVWQSVSDRGYIVAMLEQTALPALRRRLAAANAGGGDRAPLVVTLGSLQDLDVIPQLLVAAAASRSPFSPPLLALSTYEAPAALPLLSKEFLSDNADIATACINSFIKSGDKRAIPMLIDALLHSPSGEVRYTAYYALNEDTGLGGGYGPTDFPAHEQELDRFWQNWLKSNPPTPTK